MSEKFTPPAPGQTVWLYDYNRRVYDPDKRINYAASWTEAKVKKAGPVNLLLEGGRTLKHVPGSPYTYHDSTRHVVLSRKEMEDDIWLHNHRMQIGRLVENSKDVEALKQIAALVGYTEGT